MAYYINNTLLLLQPETGRWVGRDPIALDGQGKGIYPAFREFQMMWGGMSAEEYTQLYDFYLAQAVTGSSVVTLPTYATGTYSWCAYTGCLLQEPKTDEFFAEHYMNVTLLITKVRTS